MEIKVNSGAVEYNLGGKVSVWINPTDANFGNDLYNAIDALSDLQENLVVDGEIEDKVRAMVARDAEGREILNNLFGVNVCDPLYGRISVFALSDGFPLWANLLIAILEQIQIGTAEQRKASEARMKKYTKKYGAV